MYREVKGHERWTDRLTKSQQFVIVLSCLASFSGFPWLFCESDLSFSLPGAPLIHSKQEQQFLNSCSSSVQVLLSSSVFVSCSPLPHCLLLPSLALVKQQGPCDSKLRKLPIKGYMYLTGESEVGTGVCIKAKERLIWRCLSWTGQFPVSGTGPAYPETEKSCRRGKDTPPRFSCDLLH